MDIWDSLQVLDGYFQDDVFICRGILGHAFYHCYTSSELRLFANFIREDKPFTFTIDSERTVLFPVALNGQLKRELLLLADELDKSQAED